MSNPSLKREESNSIFLQQNRIMKSISRSNANSALGAYSTSNTPHREIMAKKMSSMSVKSEAANNYKRRSDI